MKLTLISLAKTTIFFLFGQWNLSSTGQNLIFCYFGQWATARLKEYTVKGFTLDDERLKQNGGRYFKELLQRI